MKNLYTLLISLNLLIILQSCHEETNILKAKNNFIFYGTINNIELLNNLTDYFQKYVANTETTKVLVLDFYQSSDTNVFDIYYEMNFTSLLRNKPLMHVKLDSINFILRTKINNFINLDSSYQNNMLRQTFPTQFNKYEKDGIILPPTTFHCKIWTLKFVNHILVKKEVN